MSFLFRYLRFHDIIGGIHVPVDDGVDKLNRKYTLLVFLFLALPIFTKQYIGDPIECFAPVYFAEHQSRYINSYCWTQSTYYMVPVGDPEDDGDQQDPPDRIMPDEMDYFIGFETVTHIGNERLRRVRVSYYQWAPLILLAQGLCFYIPFLIWNSCANNAGVKLRRLLKKASDIGSLPPGCQQREALLAEFVDQFHTLVTGEAGWCADLQCGTSAPCGTSGNSSGLGGASGSSGSSAASGSSAGGGPNSAPANRGGRGAGNNNQADDNNATGHRSRSHANDSNGGAGAGCCLVSIPIIGSLLSCCLRPCATFGLVGPSKYLCLLYLAIKSAYVFNVGLQFFLLGQFLGRGYLRHGLELITRLVASGEWWSSPRFPLSTLCQVRADMSGGLRSYTCQCVLPINVFNEKIFSVVWFYMAFLLPLNVISLLFWIYRSFETNRISYIRLCLWRTRLVELNQIHRTVRRLSQSYLGWDGVFLLRLIEHNHGSIMATLIMSRLWEFYANQMKLQEDANQLALANNAQHTLANITTAISNQHQLMASSHNAGGGAGHHPPIAPANHHHQQQHQQQQMHHGPSSQQQQQHHHHHHPSGPAGRGHDHAHPPVHGHHHQVGSGHSHGPGAHLAGHGHVPPVPLQPSQFPGANQPLAPLIPHSGGQHSGQINQAAGHHPLHAANTAAAAHHHQQQQQQHQHHPTIGPPHLSGAFTGPNASLLAQLQHQAAAAAVAASNQSAGGHQTVSHQHQAGQNSSSQQQQQPAGNVAAAVAALAAAAAAASTTTNNTQQQQQQQQQQLASTGNNTNTNNNATTGPKPPLPPPAGASATTPLQHHQAATAAAIHLHSLMQSNNNTGQNNTGSSNQQSIATGNGQLQQQQQQQQVPSGNSATTSFITASSGAAGPAGGPPLPPPPPAHVVAAVAAASVSSPAGSAPGPGAAVQHPMANNAPGSARTGPVPAALGPKPVGVVNNNNPNSNTKTNMGQTTTTSTTTATTTNNNPLNLFNLKSSSLQQATSNTNNNPNQQQQQIGAQTTTTTTTTNGTGNASSGSRFVPVMPQGKRAIG